MIELLKRWGNILLTISLAILSVFLFFRNKQHEEFDIKNDELKKEEQTIKKEIDKKKEEIHNIKVPDLNEQEVIDYWTKELK
jgi:hypothetical protein